MTYFGLANTLITCEIERTHRWCKHEYIFGLDSTLIMRNGVFFFHNVRTLSHMYILL